MSLRPLSWLLLFGGDVLAAPLLVEFGKQGAQIAEQWSGGWLVDRLVLLGVISILIGYVSGEKTKKALQDVWFFALRMVVSIVSVAVRLLIKIVRR